MRVKVLEVTWHERRSVFSVDFDGRSDRLASGGADRFARIWRLSEDGTKPTFLAELSHQSAVNVVRFSPAGETLLATAGDQGALLLWRYAGPTGGRGGGNLVDSDTVGEEVWITTRTFRAGIEDLWDVCWSPDGMFVAVAGTDKSTSVYSVATGGQIQRFSEHGDIVQGIAWDPRGQFLISQSRDRTSRLYRLAPIKGKHLFRQGTRIESFPSRDLKAPLPTYDASTEPQPPADEGHPDGSGDVAPPKAPKGAKMFVGESLSSFFRRLAWSPDGSVVIAPAANLPGTAEGGLAQDGSVVLARRDPTLAVCGLPSPKPPILVRFSPLLYDLTEVPPAPYLALPYRMVFAQATSDAVTLYDTQQTAPIAHVTGLHYRSITDLAWSRDGRFLAISSADGYVSVVAFGEGELGTVQAGAQLPARPLMSQYNTPTKAAAMAAAAEKATAVAADKVADKAADKVATVNDGDHQSKAVGDGAVVDEGPATSSAVPKVDDGVMAVDGAAASSSSSASAKRTNEDEPPKAKRRIALTQVSS